MLIEQSRRKPKVDWLCDVKIFKKILKTNWDDPKKRPSHADQARWSTSNKWTRAGNFDAVDDDDDAGDGDNADANDNDGDDGESCNVMRMVVNECRNDDDSEWLS